MAIKSTKKKVAAPTKKTVAPVATTPKPKRQRKFQSLRGFKDNLPAEQPFAWNDHVLRSRRLL